ncbi:MAG TPA: hypothetical protein VFW83_08425 [Bryobacteraceae bacterium]|nr:hypothetical protein [Bryobacteraceae bacterium]
METIIQRSTEAFEADWKAAPNYDCYERELENGSTKTYHVTMLYGSPYKELVNINGKPLSKSAQNRQKQKLNREAARRRGESPKAHAKRIGAYQKDRARDHRLIQQLTKAFDFKLSGTPELNGHSVYYLEATPKPDYQPPTRDTQVLTGMQGKMWIDRKTFQWVKVEAKVIHPVSIEGFLAQVEPGTRFELERAPVPGGVWENTHFSMRATAKILFLVTHKTQTDESYFGYQKVRE